jgi:hypothetical protein
VAALECLLCKQGVFRSPVTGNHSGIFEVNGSMVHAQRLCEVFDEDNLVDCPHCEGGELVTDEHGQEWTCLHCKGAGQVDGPR